jgi:hypothetical protein
VTAAIITIGLFVYPDYSQDMLYVSQQTIGALALALIANFVVALAAMAVAYGQRIQTFFRVLFLAFSFTLVVFFAVGFWADLYAWQD